MLDPSMISPAVLGNFGRGIATSAGASGFDPLSAILGGGGAGMAGGPASMMTQILPMLMKGMGGGAGGGQDKGNGIIPDNYKVGDMQAPQFSVSNYGDVVKKALMRG